MNVSSFEAEVKSPNGGGWGSSRLAALAALAAAAAAAMAAGGRKRGKDRKSGRGRGLAAVKS